ncbi:hypothetical protein DL240_13110 [Lujinxingia litoralis]|uniref:TM2 domain-containing protein n=1 Tax=Lujinxingia litoralis TaxID=2211119 RepID=A0A328C5C3_9DELT|nr:TM2 domain-containing protein [Lujinxingia litoralis]RAL21785.1 hypothetical protein DL240_13110 [Lujinxingia litoralis]
MTDYLPIETPHSRPPETFSHRSQVVAFTLAVFLGMFGVHRFYAGKILSGLLMFFTGGGFVLWWAIDVMTILMGRFRDAQGYRLAPPTPDGQQGRRQITNPPHHARPDQRTLAHQAPRSEEALAEEELDRLLDDPLADEFARLEREMGQDGHVEAPEERVPAHSHR